MIPYFVDVAFSLNKTYYVLIVDLLLLLIDISSVSHEMTVIEMSQVELISHLRPPAWNGLWCKDDSLHLIVKSMEEFRFEAVGSAQDVRNNV